MKRRARTSRQTAPREELEALQKDAASRPGVIGLAGGLPDPLLFPKRVLAQAFVAAAHRRGGAALQYAWPEGLEDLRRHIARHLRRRGADVRAEDLLITNGAQQALALAMQALGGKCRAVSFDPETYPAALDLARIRHVDVRVRDTGSKGARYVMPAIDNPRGRVMSQAARQAVLADSGPIIEDDAYAETRFDGHRPTRPLKADHPDRVFYVGTMSKTLCPGLRVGWLWAPASYKERVVALKHGHDLQANTLSQAIVEEYLAREDWDARLERMRRHYARKADRTLTALRKHLPFARASEPSGGFSIWVEMDDRHSEVARLRAAVRRHGVSFDPGSTFRPSDAPTPFAMRLCFSAVPARLIDEGVRRLSKVFETPSRNASKT